MIWIEFAFWVFFALAFYYVGKRQGYNDGRYEALNEIIKTKVPIKRNKKEVPL